MGVTAWSSCCQQWQQGALQAALPVRHGGGSSLGNEFSVVTDKDAYATIEAAWNVGVRYYDMAPWYGLGLAQRRYGNFLHNKNRSEYVVSSKVGKLLKASKIAKNKEYFPFSPSPNEVVYDYTASGVRRSIEDSLAEAWYRQPGHRLRA